MEQPKNIYEALAAIYKETGYVQKTGKVSFGNTRYNYAGEAAFIEAIRPVMEKFGVTITPTKIKLVFQERVLSAKGEPNMHVIISCSYVFAHISGTVLKIASMGEGKDSGDKAIPKALTGAYKYALRQAFMIETGDDPDITPSGELADSREWKTAKEKKLAGEEILQIMNACENLEELEQFRSEYKQDINAFRISKLDADKDFYQQILARGAELKKIFEQNGGLNG